MSYGHWPAYVPVAKRRAQAKKQVEKLKKKGKKKPQNQSIMRLFNV